MGEFGEYMKTKRIERGITIRKMSKDLNISVSYLSELESGVKLPPNSNKEGYNDLISKIIEYFDLNKEEENKFRYLADIDLSVRGYLSNDMSNYVNEVPAALIALRKAKDNNFSKEKWEKIIKEIEKK